MAKLAEGELIMFLVGWKEYKAGFILTMQAHFCFEGLERLWMPLHKLKKVQL